MTATTPRSRPEFRDEEPSHDSYEIGIGRPAECPGRDGGTTVPARPAADDAVREIAAAHGVTPHQIRPARTLHQGAHVLAIPGTGDVSHLEQNIAAGALRLTPGELARLGPVS